jgi:hypothetical protein
MNKTYVIVWASEPGAQGVFAAFRREVDATSMKEQLEKISGLTFTIIEVPQYG